MSIKGKLAKLFHGVGVWLDTKDRAPWSDYYYTTLAEETKSGQNVTVEGALAVSAVFAALRIVSETLAMIPIWMYERMPDRTKRPAFDHELFDVLHDQASMRQDAMEFVETMTAHACLRGRSYAQKIPGNGRLTNELVPLHPDRVTEEILSSGEIKYTYTDENDKKTDFSQDEIFTLRGFGGVSVVSYARESIGLALAAEEHGAMFFKQGMEVPIALEHPGNLSEPAQERLEKSIQEKRGGVKKHWKILILEEGMKPHKLGLTPEDSQYIESRKFQLTEIARWFRVPPHMLADLDRATFNNIEHLSLEFVTYTLLPWIMRWRQAIRRNLIRDKNRYFADFKLEMLLRADLKSRFEAYQIAIQNGIFNPNECRELENKNPRRRGDDYWIPMNMTTTGSSELPIAHGGDGARYHEIAVSAIAKLLSDEKAAIQRKAPDYASDQRSWEKWVRSYYGRHVKHVMELLGIDEPVARRYCDAQVAALLTDGVGVAEKWGRENAKRLMECCLGGK